MNLDGKYRKKSNGMYVLGKDDIDNVGEMVLHTNSLIIAVPASAEEVQRGDIVIYRRYLSSDWIIPFHGYLHVVHRLIEINEEGYVFKGDAEAESDPPVSAEQIVYRVIWPAQ